MKILSLDTSCSIASIAVQDNNIILGEYTINSLKTHSQNLLPMMNKLLEDLNLKPSDIDIFAAATGPGSFTGLRIGIATIKGLAHSLNKPVIGVSTLDGLAYNLAYFPGYICPIIDARNNNVYTALFSFNKDDLSLNIHTDYMALHIDELLNILSDKSPVIFLGDAAPKFKKLIKEKLQNSALFAMEHLILPKASSIGSAAYTKALSGKSESHIRLLPLYLRAPQPECLRNGNLA